ncbi:MAG TPA: 3D domain-containing protein, partial [bacterium]|nr:3D domain-containing protein [bacterium]
LGTGTWHWYQRAHAVYHRVVLYQMDKGSEISTAEKTVGGLLREQGIRLKPQDVVVPGINEPVTEGMEIDLGLVERQVKDMKKKIPAAIHTDYTDTLNVGEIIDVQEGKDGLEDLETESYSLNGEQAFEKILKATILTPEKDAKVLEGTAFRQKLYPLKKRARVRKIVEMQATAYYPGPENTWPYASGTTASGLKAGYGVVAVDPRFIHLKTLLYVEGYGYAIAADTGGGIKGNKIDLCFDTMQEAVQFGRKNVKVYILR